MRQLPQAIQAKVLADNVLRVVGSVPYECDSKGTIPAPPISQSPGFRCFALQFRHRPSVNCPISCRTLPVSLFRTTILAPSLSELPDFLSDAPGFLVQNHDFSTVPQ